MVKALSKDHLAKILVIRYQYSFFSERDSQNFFVRNSLGVVKNGKDIMATGFEPFRGSWAGSFINDETHLGRLHNQRHKLGPAQRFSGKK